MCDYGLDTCCQGLLGCLGGRYEIILMQNI